MTYLRLFKYFLRLVGSWLAAGEQLAAGWQLLFVSQLDAQRLSLEPGNTIL